MPVSDSMLKTKHNIKNIAIGLFYKKGYFATSISEIANGCGIRKASIYYHYPSKEDLLFSILSETMTCLMDHLHNSLAGIEDTEDRMRAAVRGHVQFHLNRQKENFIANSELRGLTREHCRIIVKKRDTYEKIFQGLIQQGIKQGVFHDCDIKILSYAILTLCTSGASWFNPGGRLTVDEIAGIYETFILNGLKQGFERRSCGF